MQEKIRNDIIESISRNLHLCNITADDARQLPELTGRLHEHICAEFNRKKKGDEELKPLLPGALELPNDKYRFRIDELEKEILRYADENARYADENAKYADEILRYADEIVKLKKRIAELEKEQQTE